MPIRRLAVIGGTCSLLLATTSVAHAGPVQAVQGAGEHPSGLELQWEACGITPQADEAGVQCARAPLPLDHDEPEGERIEIAVGRVPAADPASRIGSLFINFGGPGGPAVEYLQVVGAGVFEPLNQYFDIVAFDPRGVGQSTPAVDCEVSPVQEPLTLPTPDDVDVEALVADAQAYVDACVAANGERRPRHGRTARGAR